MSMTPRRPTVLTAMVSPMRPDGSIDLDGAQRVARHLVDSGHDGIVVNGTTGEAPTTTDAEKVALLRSVLAVVGEGITVIAGVGTNDTAHSVRAAQAAEAAGAHGLLAVAPYYNKPPQAGVQRHFETIADSTGLPVMLYDIPGRSGIPIATETLVRLAEHPRIVAVKDAKGDLWAASTVMSRTDLSWYSGDDVLNLAHLTQGAVGVVSVVGHIAGRQYGEMVAAVAAGDLARAIAIHRGLIPLVDAIMNTSQGAITAKVALVELGVIEHPTVRLPLVEGPPEHLERVRAGLRSVIRDPAPPDEGQT